MWKYSKDGGKTWSQRKALTGATTLASPTGLGFFNKTDRPRGLQLMPSIGCTAGDPNRSPHHLLRVATVCRGRRASVGSVGERFCRRRRPPRRRGGGLIDAPNSNSITAYPSSQLSRYTYRTLNKGEVPTDTTGPNGDVEKICAPDNSHCADALNYSGRPHTGAGTSPFMHDYNTVRPVVPWVKDKQNGAWRLAKTAADVPYAAGFGVAWADN